ncbi:right-handed parallel beta-helix repeat-containing protein [Roseomonas fluvialis]|uniref:right-handed parallel beta-helix repeat-containing protein n=1 Tax=Roseomonas fluvialis TaxID=1750527 RepID=UPI001FCBA49E|nr:right-handed parallel beta-helix repeat-containing protein [Roseomonas fluvialis]
MNTILPAGVESLALAGTSDLVGVGNSQSNIITGNAGSNVILGGAGNDTILGGDGVDILRGDAGTDHLLGNGGTDIFVVSAVEDSRPGAQRDVIYEFNITEDVLHLVDLAPGVPISHLGGAAFQGGGSTVQTRLDVQGGDAVLQIDIPNGWQGTDGVADAEVLLRGVQSLQAWNILGSVAASGGTEPAEVGASPPPTPAPVAAPPGVVAPTTSRSVYIDPSASRSGDGSLDSPFSSWGGRTLEADTSYLIKAGTVMNGVVVVKGQGSEDAPITIGSYGAGAAPVIQGSISVENAAHVTISDLAIVNSAYAGVTVQGGSHDITVLNNTIQNTSIGVWFSATAGGGNLVQGNEISGSQLHGVAFNKVDQRADPTRVVDNVIRDSGSHGIAVNASGIVVDGNDVSRSGLTVSGSSGIHIYGGYGSPDGFGFGNVIANNRVSDSREAGNGYDGNGIQADQYTGGNRIENNTVSGSDGAGIILYDSASNLVIGNTVGGNLLDRSGQHPYRGEILLAGDIDVRSELTRGNVIQNNVVTTDDATTSAFFIDPTTADNGNVFGGNTVVREAGGPAYSSGGIYGAVGSNLALWNSTLAPGGGDDVWS